MTRNKHSSTTRNGDISDHIRPLIKENTKGKGTLGADDDRQSHNQLIQTVRLLFQRLMGTAVGESQSTRPPNVTCLE